MGQQHPSRSPSCSTFQQVHHPPLNTPASLTILVYPNSQKRIEYLMPVQQKQTCKKWQNLLKSYFNNIDTSLFYLPIRYQYKGTQFCSSAGVINVQYEYFKTTMAWEIKERCQIAYKFGEGFIWRIAYVLAKCAKLLNSNCKKLGKIGLEAIFLNKQTKDIRVANGLTFFSDMIIAQIISPQQLLSNNHYHNSPPLSTILSQSFSIGIVLASICLLIENPPSSLRESVSQQQQLQKINQLQGLLIRQQFYSKQLVNMILSLINVDANKRFNVGNLVQMLENNMEFMVYCRSFSQSSDNVYHQMDQQMEHHNKTKEPNPIPETLLPIPSSSPISPPPQFSNIQKVTSQYIPYKSSQQQLDPYIDFFAMVDSQLQKSRRTFPSSLS